MKQTIKINASSLPLSKCILSWHRTIIQGYKSATQPANMVYGTALHAFIDAMYKTDGRLDIARDAALKKFRVPKFATGKYQDHLSDETHLVVTCYNLWENWVKKQANDFDVLMLNSKCFWCGGCGEDMPVSDVCKYCNGTGSRLQPATEITFSIPYYEDEQFIVKLEGTLDRLGKFKKGCYCYRDWKSTSSRDEDYLKDFEMSGQLKFYLLALKLMAEKEPQSVLGQIGATNVCAAIDGIFLNKKVQDITYETSEVFQFKQPVMDEYRELLDMKIAGLLQAIRNNKWHLKEGIINGACQQRYSKCPWYVVCKSQDNAIAEVLLKRDFVQKEYNPLQHND